MKSAKDIEIQQMRIIVSTMFVVMGSAGWVGVVMALVLYMFGCVGVFMFGTNDPHFFGTIGRSMLVMLAISAVLLRLAIVDLGTIKRNLGMSR